jgi:hypothetical protein
MNSDNPMIEWCKKTERNCLKFIFKEILTEQDATAAIAQWRQSFQTAKEKSIVLIWDCRKMKGYDSAARVKWTEALRQLKSRIETIWLISESPIVRMGASVIGLALSVKIKAIKSETDIAV